MSLIRHALVFSLAMFLPSATFSDSLSLAYFMGPRHPMNAAVFEPFAERLEEVSEGALTVQQFPGGALNSVPPRQYDILLDGIADIVFTLPGYTADRFPLTTLISIPQTCDSPTACTQALLNVRDQLSEEYDAKILAVWANAPPVLITRDQAVRSPSDLEGMKIRVTSRQDIPFVEALGATALVQPVSEINQNLTNGVIDGIMIDTSAIRSFRLNEAGNYITTWSPMSGAAFVLLMNNDVYNGLSEQERAWIDEASGDWLSLSGAAGFEAASAGGLQLAIDSGMEIIEFSESDVALLDGAVEPVLQELLDQPLGDGQTIGKFIEMMTAE